MNDLKRILIASVALALGACSFEVTNPGPVEDASLDDPGAYPALVTGVRYNLSRAISIVSYYSGGASKEIGTAGRVIGTKLPLDFGQLTPDDMSGNNFTWSQAARWQAEDGIRRLRETLGTDFASNEYAGQLLMYAALANRVLGENFCEAVIDGGPKEPSTMYFTNAAAQATEAIDVATAAGDQETADAARAIRATLRLYAGDNAGADADAAAVPLDFELEAPFDQQVQNILVQSNDRAIGGSFRATTTWLTFYDDYYRTSGDPRVQWDSSSNMPDERFGEFDFVYWYFQEKYTERGSPINLLSGREMKLVRAEVALRNNDIPTALGFINELRDGLVSNHDGTPLADWTAANLDEAWTAFKRERGIELWLEGRRMYDLKRWWNDPVTRANGRMEDITNRIRMCFPIPRAERTTNANLSLELDDPVNPFYTGHSGGSTPDDWAWVP